MDTVIGVWKLDFIALIVSYVCVRVFFWEHIFVILVVFGTVV